MKRALPRSPIDFMLMAFVLWFGSYVGDYLLWTRGKPKPLYFYVAVICLAMFYALVRGAMRGSLSVLHDKWTRWFLIWLLAYLVYGVLIFMESSQSDVAVQALITLGEMVMLGGAFSVLMLNPARLRQVSAMFVVLAVLDTGLFLIDFVHPMFSKVPGRAAGLYIDPNVAGYSLAFAMICGIESVPARLRGLFVLACGLGVLVTFSRESWIIWGVSVAYLGWHSEVRASRKILVVTASLLLGVGFLIAVFSGELGSLMMHTPLAPYLNENTLGRLGTDSSALSDFAAERRTDLIWFSLQSAAEAPLFGHGSGYVYEWAFPVGPHNMFLRFLVEGGFFGMLFYMALLQLLWFASSGLERVIVVEIIIASFFSHNLLEMPTVIIVMTFVLARNAVRRRQRREALALQYGSAIA